MSLLEFFEDLTLLNVLEKIVIYFSSVTSHFEATKFQRNEFSMSPRKNQIGRFSSELFNANWGEGGVYSCVHAPLYSNHSHSFN